MSRLICTYALTLYLFMFLEAFLSYSVLFYLYKFNIAFIQRKCARHKRFFVSIETNFLRHE